MKKPEKIGLYLFIYLASYFSITFTVLVLIVRWGIFLFYFLKTGESYFFWKDDVFYAIKMGVSVGAILGAGVCVISKLEEREKDNSPPSDPK